MNRSGGLQPPPTQWARRHLARLGIEKRVLLDTLGLLKGWRRRNCLGPLRHLLRRWPSFSTNAGESRELLSSLRNIRTQSRQILAPKELTFGESRIIDGLIRDLEKLAAH